MVEKVLSNRVHPTLTCFTTCSGNFPITTQTLRTDTGWLDPGHLPLPAGSTGTLQGQRELGDRSPKEIGGLLPKWGIPSSTGYPTFAPLDVPPTLPSAPRLISARPPFSSAFSLPFFFKQLY